MSTCIEASNLKELTARIRRHACDSLRYLNKKLIDGYYQGRSFYGETYTALAMSLIDYDQYQPTISRVLEWYSENPKTDDNFHWEFNNYALLNLIKEHQEFSSYVKSPLIYRNVTCTNWSLLRCVGKLLEGRSIEEEKIKEKIAKMQLENGLILDENHVSSFQYHCFMVSLLYELYCLAADDFYLESFKRGVKFIENFTLRNGDTLLIGRGQEQIFGYGTLIYIYAIAYKLFNETKYLNSINKVLNFIASFWDEKRILPLVLNEVEVDSQETLPITDERHPGWYSYNNYYDYLPFFTYYLVKTEMYLSQFDDVSFEDEYLEQNYLDKYFCKSANENLEVVLGCWKGASANALVFPYIQFKGKEVTSICGGDDFVPVGYNQMKAISLPYGKYALSLKRLLTSKWYLKKTIKGVMTRDAEYNISYLWMHGSFRLSKKSEYNKFELIAECEDYKFLRNIELNLSSIEFTDSFEFKSSVKYKYFKALNLLLPNVKKVKKNEFIVNGFTLKFDDLDVVLDKKMYMSAKGELDALSINYEDFRINKNDMLKIKYKFEF